MVNRNNSFNDAIGQKIALKRKEVGFTQSYLAKKIGKPQSILSEYETGVKRIYPEILYKISIALGISILELFPQDENDQFDHKLFSRFKKIQTFPEIEKEFILKLLDLFLKSNDPQ